jgi:ubiquinone biosynthesis UbiH/UbiF/VisC/COQ6 family hydroxylase
VRHSSSTAASATTRAEDAPKPVDTTTTDVLIVGGGVVGCALAQQLTQRAPGLRIGVVETQAAAPVAAPINKDTPPHPRSYALSPASLALLGLDRHSSKNRRVGFYDSLQIWEAAQPASLIFQASDASASGADNDSLGAVVEDTTLVQHLRESLEDCRNVRIWEGSRVMALALPASDGHAPAQVTIATQNGAAPPDAITSTIHTNLVVGADGANSAVRRFAGIPRTHYDYGHTALTCTVQLAGTHGGRAFQRFMPHGPLALLPTFSPDHAIVVWSTTAEEAAHWKHHPDLVRHVNDLLQDGPARLEPLVGSFLSAHEAFLPTALVKFAYGVDKLIETAQYGPAMAAQQVYQRPFLAPPTITSVASAQFTFPLSTGQVHRYTDPRLALVGDAAHTVHPLAGQGLNLGLQDVANLADLILRAAEAGMDVASFLQDYEKSRTWQVSLTVGGIHALQRMFGVQHVAAKHAKSLGMNAIQMIPPLRQALVDVACQGVAR